MALHLLFSIENPDKLLPGGITLGMYMPDTVEVYWDSTTSSILNSHNTLSPQYGGTQLGSISDFYFCEEGTLNQFRLTIRKPFAERLQINNAPECSVVPDVCDAYIENPLIIRHPTNGLNNGSVTIRGYTSKPNFYFPAFPPIVPVAITYTTMYSIDGGQNWQASPTFSGLAPGTYTVTMQDVAGCSDSKTFEIEPSNQYTVRFTANYKDYLGQTTRIDILKRGYDGIPEEVRVSDNPLIIKERAENLFTEVRGQECTVSLLAEHNFHYLELFTGDDREFRIEVYKGVELFWTGWVVPEVYQEPYLAPPFAVSISATDGLGELKNYDFTQTQPEGFMSQWDVIMHVLNKTNIYIPITCGINLYETRMNKSETDEPLKQAIVSLSAYHSKDILNCASVLSAVLRSYGGFIRQNKGRWSICRVEEFRSSFPKRHYDPQGNYLSYELYHPNKLITGPHTGLPIERLFWVEESQFLEMRPAFKQTAVRIDFGLRENMIRGGDMDRSAFDAGMYHKYIDGPAFLGTEMVEPKNPDQYAIVLASVDNYQDASYIQTERVFVKKDPLLSLYFKFEYKVIASKFLTPDTARPPSFIFSIHLNDKTLNFPAVAGLNNSLEWRAQPNRFEIPSANLHNWQTAELFVPNIPEDGWLTIRIFELADNGYEFANLWIKRIVAIPFRSVSPALAEDETYISINARKQFFLPPTVEATHGDVIPLKNAPAIYRNLIMVNGISYPSLDWQRRGKMEAEPLLKLLSESILALNETPVKLLRGTLKGAFDFDQVIQEAEVLTRYMPIGFEYNDVDNTISSEFMELLGTTQPRPEKRLLMETGQPLLLEDNTFIALES